MYNLAAQDLSGEWQGMEYAQGSTANISWPTSIKITQTGNKISGECYQEASGQKQYYVMWELDNGSVRNNEGSIDFKNVRQQELPPGTFLCHGTMDFTYYPEEEKLIGQLTYTNCSAKATMELYRIRLKSENTYCAGEPAELVVTGKNVRWYADPQRNKLLHTGNAYLTKLARTDTFYVTQTYYDVETPPAPFVIQVREAGIEDLKVTHANCGKNNGAISLRGTGEAPLSFRLDEGTFQSTPAFSDLLAKTYRITVKTAGGCMFTQEVNVERKTPPSFLTVATDPPCSETTGNLNVVGQGGYGPLTYALDNGPPQTGHMFSGLKVGEYVLKMRDSVGCETSMPVKIAEPQKSVSLLDVEVQHAFCGAQHGTIRVIAAGEGILMYSIEPSGFTTSNVFTQVTPGEYEVVVRNQAGCTARETIVVGKFPTPVITQVIESPVDCDGNGGAISVVASGSGPVVYAIDGTNFGTASVFTNLSPGQYFVNVMDTLGCVVGQSFEIRSDCISKLFIPTAFSPDENGTNEKMELKFATDELKIKSFRLFSRWGTVIAFTDQKVRSGHVLWDGVYNGAKAQPGSYPYELAVEFDNGKVQTIRGTILLVR